MIDNRFRQFLQSASERPVKLLAKSGVHPDLLTFTGFCISGSSFFFTLHGHYFFALSAWWLGRLFDGLDGLVARASNRQSLRGGFLDINLDMAVYSLIAVGFMMKGGLYLPWAIIISGYTLCITSALSLGEMERLSELKDRDNRSLRLASGLAEAGETGLFYSLLWLVPRFEILWCRIWILILTITVLARYIQAFRIGKKL